MDFTEEYTYMLFNVTEMVTAGCQSEKEVNTLVEIKTPGRIEGRERGREGRPEMTLQRTAFRVINHSTVPPRVLHFSKEIMFFTAFSEWQSVSYHMIYSNFSSVQICFHH